MMYTYTVTFPATKKESEEVVNVRAFSKAEAYDRAMFHIRRELKKPRSYMRQARVEKFTPEIGWKESDMPVTIN